MRETEFREWLGQRRYRGKPLTTINQRLNWCRAVERALPELGLEEGDLEAVHAAGRWQDLLTALSRLRSDWRNNEAAAKVIAPQSENPAGQMANARASVGTYGRFLAGDDPNYDTQSAGSGEDGDLLTDEDILGRFSGKEGFASWWANWSDADRQSFFRVARALHDAGLDWYHVNIERQVRCGRKKKGAIDATEVFVAISNLEPSCWVRRAPDRAALGLPETAVSLAALADSVEASPDALQRFAGGTAYWPDELAADRVAPQDKVDAAESDPAPIRATNLILYGPPGTGKTYRTAAEAVRLCDGLDEQDPLLTDPERRGELMARYRQLASEERIDFVTFHQSIGYEDFVEGLRPTTLTEEGAEMAAGFRLEAMPGAFRKIAERAEALSLEETSTSFSLEGRKFFKMSLGEAGNPADDYLFEEAMDGGFLHMGDESGIDWSEPRFDSKMAMIAAYADAHPDSPVLSPLAGAIEFPFTLRHRMRRGDIVIVSKGNLAFRAIGEVTGDYENVERDDLYTIRRGVKWHWVDRAGLSYDVINNKRFSQRTVYELAPAELKMDAVQTLLDSSLEGGAPRRVRNFVLVIDEINRANISKVFGELITLIEPDKRLGQANELRVLLPHSKKPFGVPSNLHIVGTMNTADRSIALLDTALRRRFVFREIGPQPELLPEEVEGVPLRRVLEAMNDRIEYLVDRDHRIGHAFFMGEGGKDRAAIDATMRDKVIPLLQEYFFEDWSRVAAVLNEPRERGGGFLDCRKLGDPTGRDGEARLSWTVRAKFAEDAYVRLVGAGASPDAAAADAE